MNVLVTGGAGYIGSHAHRHLLDYGHQVSVIDDLSHGHEWAIDTRAKFFKGNISDSTLVGSVLKNEKIEAVMHFAAFIEVAESVTSPEKYYRNNFSNALLLLEAMLSAGVKKFIFSSTAAVYGNPKSTPITEDQACDPINPYGRSKRMLELALTDLSKSHNLQFTALRYFNVAGASSDGKLGEAHEPESHLIPRILAAALSPKEPLSIFGTDYDTRDGTCIRDYIHIEDLVDAHHLALKNMKDGSADFYNLGSAQGFSVQEVLAACSEVVGKAIPSKVLPRRPGDPPVLIASRDKAIKYLGWKPKYYDLRIIVEHAWKWHRSR